MLYLAMSCFQGRTQDAAWDSIVAWFGEGVGGVQLTPGNLPSPGFRERVEASRIPTRRHHGFSWGRLRRKVWAPGPVAPVGDGGLPFVACFSDPGRSVHPPPLSCDAGELAGVFDEARRAGWALETMYPGHLLGTGAELVQAMEAGVELAVDVSHLHIQRTAGVLSDAELARVLTYDHIVEVHVSANDGRADQHRPLQPDSFLLKAAVALARDRAVPLVWETYLHKQTREQVLGQLELLVG